MTVVLICKNYGVMINTENIKQRIVSCHQHIGGEIHKINGLH